MIKARWIWCFPLVLLAAGGLAVSSEREAGGNADESANAVPMFDELVSEPDLIYLLASSSIVPGPDPNARSEEITFTGFVTVPKWPMPGYQRRELPSGRQQIDIELTESDLVGASYLLGGNVYLGEHPDLRSLGTITESADKGGSTVADAAVLPSPFGFSASALATFPVVALAGSTQMTATASQGPSTATALVASTPVAMQRQTRNESVDGTTFPVTENLELLMDSNPNILWDEILATELRRLLERRNLIEEGQLRPTVVPPPAAALFARKIDLPDDLLEKIRESGIDFGPFIYEAAENLAADLLDRRVIDLDEDSFNPALIPNDFVVARKVLITTAKGVLYNETPVPVRGTVDSIPPVKRPDTPLGVNVFMGMELPIELLDEEGNVDGWFYSKAHMAYAVVPDAIQRDDLEASLEIRSGERTETVSLEGRMEIHHRDQEDDTEIEVIVLELRGESELLDGEIMMIEAFSDRDRFSRGLLADATSGSRDASFDFFLEVYTPADKLANETGIHMEGRLSQVVSAGKLEKGNLSIPLLAMETDEPFVATNSSPLFDEAGRRVAEIVGLTLDVAKR